MRWLEAVNRFVRDGVAHVLVTVVAVEGSAPRSVGCKMVVSESATVDTIGGGNLEYQAILQARKLLESNQRQIQQCSYTLGDDLAQCCGGRVTVMFDVFTRPALDIVLFGAGHIGRSLALILAELDCRLNWFDSRQDYLPAHLSSINIATHHYHNPYTAVEACQPGCTYLVMTHSHALDLELVEAVLSRNDAAFCGLIASKSKAAKFRNRLRRKGFTDQEVGQLVAPLGLATGVHKEPMAVAVAVVAQLLEFCAPPYPEKLRSPLNNPASDPANDPASVQQ